MNSQDHSSNVSRFPLLTADTAAVEAFVAIVRRLSIARSLQEVMEIVTHAARTLLSADGITFVLRDGDRCYYAEEDAVSPLWKGRRFPMSACISGWCMLQRRSAVISDIYADDRIPHDAYRPTFVRSLAMVPVRQDDPIAAMGAYWGTKRNIKNDEVELLQSIANAAALALAYVDLQNRNTFRDLTSWIATRLGSLFEARHSAPGPSRNDVASVDQPRRWYRLSANSVAAYAFAGVCVLIASVARLLLGLLIAPDLVPFATFFPAVFFAALVGGAAAGTVALVAGGVVGWWAFMAPYFTFAMSPGPYEAASIGLYAVCAALIVWGADRYRKMTAALDAKERERHLLTQELQHRSRNTLSVVQAVVRQSLHDETDRAGTINRRIAALVTATELTPVDTSPAARDLHKILQVELEPYGLRRCTLMGDAVTLSEEHAKAMRLVVHELATNAAKYGALSVPKGRLSIEWHAVEGEIKLVWQEMDGPPVVAVEKRGFGTYLIEQVLARAAGQIQTSWRPGGIVHELSLRAGAPAD